MEVRTRAFMAKEWWGGSENMTTNELWSWDAIVSSQKAIEIQLAVTEGYFWIFKRKYLILFCNFFSQLTSKQAKKSEGFI